MKRAERPDLNSMAYWDMTWDRFEREDGYALLENERQRSWPMVLRAVPKRGRFLDVGCSSGFWLTYLREHRPRLELTGMDYSRSAISHGEGRLLVGDALAMPFPAGAFDIVYSGHLIEHVQDPWAVLREQGRVLRPGGRIIVNFPYGDGPYVEHVWNDIRYGDLGLGLRWLGFQEIRHTGVVPGPPVAEGVIWGTK